MGYVVDFVNVSTVGVESSPVADALAGLRANEARYFKNKYDLTFTTEPASKAKKLVTYVANVLKQEWERQYAEAHARWETHRKQVAEQRKKDAEAIAAAAEAAGEAAADAPTSYSSPSNDEGALATDEALQALRDKLSGE